MCKPLATSMTSSTKPLRRLRKSVRHDAATFHSADGVFDAHAHLADELVDGLLERVEFAAPRFLLRLQNGAATRWGVALKARVLEHQRVGRKDEPALVSELFVVHAAGAGWSQVDHALLTAARDQEVLFAVGFLLAAVVVFLALLVFGAADRPLGAIDGQEHPQLGHLLQELLQISRPPGGQEQLTSQRGADQRCQPSNPQAHLRLAQAKEHAHDFLQGIALEVEEHEEEPPGRSWERPQVARGSKGTLALLPEAVDLRAPLGQTLLESVQEPGKLVGVQAGERTQNLRFTQSDFDVHALCLADRPESSDYKV